MDGDIKSLLDVMWLLILNYGIHSIEQSRFQRSVGVAKKSLLEWCQGELDATFDSKCSLTFNLCTGNWFSKLLQIFAGTHFEEAEDKLTHLHKLLQEMDERYGIKRTIISPTDIVDGTVDEHTLMIYLSLLKRRVCTTVRSTRREMLSVDGKEAAQARVQEKTRTASAEADNCRRKLEAKQKQQEEQLQKQRQQKEKQQQQHLEQKQQQQKQQQPEQRTKRSVSADSCFGMLVLRDSSQAKGQDSADSDWMSCETNSLFSGREHPPVDRKNSLMNEAEKVLMQTISEKVREHIPRCAHDEDKDTDASQEPSSERDTESVSEFSSGLLDEGYVTVRNEASEERETSPKEKAKGKTQTETKQPSAKCSNNKEAKQQTAARDKDTKEDNAVNIKIKRPKDYFLQWEETIDRLSSGPSSAPDVSDMSPRSPRQILQGITDTRSPRSTRSRSETSNPDVIEGLFTPMWKRRDHFEQRSLSHSSDYRGQHSPRHKSLPSTSFQSHHGTSAERLDSRGRSAEIKSKSKRTNSRMTQSRETAESQQTGRENGGEEKARSIPSPPKLEDSLQQEPIVIKGEGSSHFMARLEELEKSGRAQRVVLPDLGTDAPVLMISGQGDEVLLMFDALRQARLDVDLNMNTTNGSPKKSSNGSKSPPETLPGQVSEETDLKKVAKAQVSSISTDIRNSPSMGEEKDTDSILPRNQHRMPKPMDMRVADLRCGRFRDLRRTQSMSERHILSPLVSSPDSPRYHSLSPRREQSPPQTQANGLLHLPADSSRISIQGASTDRSDISVNSSSRRNHFRSLDSIPRSYAPSLEAFRGSPPSSPYGRVESQAGSLSPVQIASPRQSPIQSRTPDWLPPLELPGDLTSPRPKQGGMGRVPRREAWERERQKKEPSDTNGLNSSAQSRFIEILYKEIEDLKQKIETMEESSPERRSLSRRGQRTPCTPTGTGQNDTFFAAQSEIQETDTKMLLTRKDAPPGDDTQSSFRSPRPFTAVRSNSNPAVSPRHHPSASSLSPRCAYNRNLPASGRTLGRQSPSPDRSHISDFSPRKGVGAEALGSARLSDTTEGTRSPRRPGQPINLGYKSPARGVTEEIWGGDLALESSLQPIRRDKFRRLIAQRSLSEQDIIELKQALASAVVENDILQAKLRNARYEIQEKLNKTNEVLDDCRRHLAKSQAENMELRTIVEREKERADASGVRGRDLQLIVEQVHADNSELEEELTHTLSMLSESKPDLDALKEQNAQLLGKTSLIINENSSLKREMDDLRRGHLKSVNTVRELRSLLDEVRGERSDLQKRLSQMERSQKENKVKSIIAHYHQEKGAKDETEREVCFGGVTASSDRFHSRQSSSRETTPRAASPRASSVSTSPAPPPVSPGRGLSYSYEDLPPAVPSTYREIYPHRKLRYQSASSERYGNSPVPHDSPVTFIDYPDLQHFPTRLGHMESDEDNRRADSYSRSRSRESSPIYRPVPYRPYLTEDKPSLPKQTMETGRGSRGASHQTRGRSLVRLSLAFRESRSISPNPAQSLSSARLSRSYDNLKLAKTRSTSSSPARFDADSRRGILKHGSRSRDSTPSPRYLTRGHSPPTRLSPNVGITAGRKLVFADEVPRPFQRGQGSNGRVAVDRTRYSSMSWFELQL